jgi:aldehyde dehydrogenase (NAD+)
MNDFMLLVASQREYFLSGATRSHAFRVEQLRKLQSWIERNEQAILDALKADLGKSDYEGYLTEVAMVRQELKDAIRHLKGWMKPRRVKTAIGQMPGACRILSEP